MKRTRTVELAWAAGFFDGEGCIVARVRPATRGSSLALQIAQIDERPLQRFKDAVGFGYITGPHNYPSRGGNRSPIWRYQVGSFSEVIEVLTRLWPFLSEPKKEQAETALQAWEDRPMSAKKTLVGRR